MTFYTFVRSSFYTLAVVAVTVIIVFLVLAYTNVYETDVKSFLKNETFFPHNLWSTFLKRDKDYDGYINYYKSGLCQQMNEYECKSSSVRSFCEYDPTEATCNIKRTPNGKMFYETDEYEKAIAKLHEHVCSEMPISTCIESSSRDSGLCELYRNSCVPRSDDIAAPSPAPFSALFSAPSPTPSPTPSPSFPT